MKKLLLLILLIVGLFAQDKTNSLFDNISIDLGINTSWMPSSFLQTYEIKEKGVIQYDFGLQ